MALNDAKQAVSELTDREWDEFLSWALNDHRDYRINRPVVEKARAELVAELVDAGKLDGAKFISRADALDGVKPPSWRAPGSDTVKMFPYGAVVSRYSKVYLSGLEGELNRYEPGGKDTPEGVWHEITEEVKAAAKQREAEAASASEGSTEPEPESEAAEPAPDAAPGGQSEG